jgi:hypothetical protein
MEVNNGTSNPKEAVDEYTCGQAAPANSQSWMTG